MTITNGWPRLRSKAKATEPLPPPKLAGEAEAHRDWTSGFLDERLPEPVSPLGWSVLRNGLEELAFREPLRLLGVDPTQLEPLTRLWNGHPYANVAIFEALYKLFPDWLLPEDAHRYFPRGAVARRKNAPRPRSIFAREVIVGLLGALARDPFAILPPLNFVAWDRFERGYTRALAEHEADVTKLEEHSAPDVTAVVSLLDRIEVENRRLLRIHRWSLTDAEVSYSLLRRLASRLLGPDNASEYCAHVVRAHRNASLRLNRALTALAGLRSSGDPIAFEQAFTAFLAEFGHRSFSLDLMRPGFAAEPGQVLAVIERYSSGHPPEEAGQATPRIRDLRALARWLLWPLALLARRYSRLREDQRFAWQRGLALARRLYLAAGRALVAQGHLAQPDDIFFLTAAEIVDASHGSAVDLASRAALRAKDYAANCALYARDASGSYPRFLHGDQPIGTGVAPSELRGVPVSPGIGRGRARLVFRPDDLASIQPGDILVARAADPGWTVVFDRLAALVTESGGQLSHASVVAREYRLPAVVTVPNATTRIQTGDEVVVDGGAGTVRFRSF